MDVGNSPSPHHDEIIPKNNAAHPAIGVDVASAMAGKVITASVTYGT